MIDGLSFAATFPPHTAWKCFEGPRFVPVSTKGIRAVPDSNAWFRLTVSDLCQWLTWSRD